MRSFAATLDFRISKNPSKDFYVYDLITHLAAREKNYLANNFVIRLPCR